MSVPPPDLSPEVGTWEGFEEGGKEGKDCFKDSMAQALFSLYRAAQCLWVVGRALCQALEESVLGMWIQK